MIIIKTYNYNAFSRNVISKNFKLTGIIIILFHESFYIYATNKKNVLKNKKMNWYGPNG